MARSGGREREQDAKRAALERNAVDLDATAVRFDPALHVEQAESRRRVLDRVADEVRDGLADPDLVAAHDHRRGGRDDIHAIARSRIDEISAPADAIVNDARTIVVTVRSLRRLPGDFPRMQDQLRGAARARVIRIASP
jgi:hypothetical protein